MPARTRNHITGGLTVALLLGLQATGWTAAESICPAPRATCVLPAARLAEPPAGYFHHGGIHAFTTVLDDNCAEPLATCVLPPARFVDASPSARMSTPITATIPELLAAWADATQDHAALNLTEKQWLARRHEPWLSAVTLDTVVRLTQSVNAGELARDFNWTLGRMRDDAYVLHGVPTDETQRLFCPQLRVELDAATRTLTTIDVADRTGTWRPIDLPWAVLPTPARGEPTILLTASAIELQIDQTAAVDIPPSPITGPALRLAAEALELPIPR